MNKGDLELERLAKELFLLYRLSGDPEWDFMDEATRKMWRDLAKIKIKEEQWLSSLSTAF